MDVTGLSEREQALRARFGELLTMADLAVVLRYPSISAIRKARFRGKLAVRLTQVPSRRGWFATPRAVAEFLEILDRDSPPVEETTRK